MRLSLRTKITLGICILVVGLMASVLAAATLSTTRAVQGKIESDLLTAHKVFEQFQQLRFQHLLSVNTLLADVPQLKAVMTTPGLDHATILDSARAAQQLLGSELLMLTDPQGRLLASVTEPTRHGDELAAIPAFASALGGEPFAGIWVTGEKIYQVVASPLLFADEVAGAVLTGFAIDSAEVEVLERMTNCQVALIAPETLVTSGSSARLFEKLRQKLPVSAETASSRVLTTTVNGERYLMMVAPFGGNEVSYVLASSLLARSLDQALLFYRQLQRGLIIMAGVILLIALIGGVLFSRKITQPIQALVTHTQRIAAGDFEAQVNISSRDELEGLADAFNRMSGELKRVLQHERGLAAQAAITAVEKQRAEELTKMNAALKEEKEAVERMNRIMMDREGRILELKQEINALLQEAGKPPKFGA